MTGNWSWGAVITWHIEAGEDFWWEGMYTWVAYLWKWEEDVWWDDFDMDFDIDHGHWKCDEIASGWKHSECPPAWMVHRW